MLILVSVYVVDTGLFSGIVELDLPPDYFKEMGPSEMTEVLQEPILKAGLLAALKDDSTNIIRLHASVAPEDMIIPESMIGRELNKKEMNALSFMLECQSMQKPIN